ncbi:hypothetical protein BCR41DRAFT_368415 [Lobosporangium transversale]|uniref:Uncharacterized protein n=1 Tax=Lobosporangium transversale TaxID=64571 RepID=A0A1Y2GVK0_9FUNG|nr:hypothetical protein BCR41DRAFT_368415 [Lobosporangium transversale]ORZ26330.1 hypothetical protein BCR41DRAFT_368415 [Lobosporangium transversale]|eukprot:XP_021884095.1 hypothetical protein BCR41DRAFT_368415 [Lobosporangium transversale]
MVGEAAVVDEVNERGDVGVVGDEAEAETTDNDRPRVVVLINAVCGGGGSGTVRMSEMEGVGVVVADGDVNDCRIELLQEEGATTPVVAAVTEANPDAMLEMLYCASGDEGETSTEADIEEVDEDADKDDDVIPLLVLGLALTLDEEDPRRAVWIAVVNLFVLS